MVKEHRYLFDLEDISSLIYTCNKCGHEAVCKIDGDFAPTPHCAGCRNPILKPNVDGIDARVTFLINLRHVLDLMKADKSVRLRLTVPDSPLSE